ncbi:type IX secretion system membrane protein PorP/SprF [Flavobacteriales bacterium]|jgi:type IX secretion system PorP/SprF family membrane protein|nr:type IX secretion system membrane protein PorP/SprF [Flavobacteriales bacterium]
MKKIIILILAVISVTVSAQQDPQFSQNMFNKLANNPGFAGSRGVIATSILHRSQWMGFGDDGGAAASTQNFSVDAELPFLYGGVGLNVVNDNIAEFSNLGLQASYAYRTELGVGQIGMGMSVGMYQSGLNGSRLTSAQDNDPAIPKVEVKGSSLDIGAGIYYNTQDVYIGLSSAHMTEPTIEWSDGQDFDLVRHYFLIAGYYHELNPLLSLNPSIYLKSDGATSQLDINTNLIYNNKMWGGVSYRLDEGLILLAGMNVNEDLRFGLAYDVTMINSMSNSIEIMLGYNFKIKTNKAISKYKNPRFL